MLVQLKVKNFALIEDALLTFDQGLNVLTGETGAGKSILMEALGFVLGNRFESEWLRPGSGLSVEAVFQILENSPIGKDLIKKGVTLEEDVLTLKRESNSSGKSRSFLNGTLTTASQIKQIAPRLVDIFGQRESESIYEPAEQHLLLDILSCVGADVEKFQAIYVERAEFLSKKQKLLDSLSGKEREMDLLQYQIKEIEDARIHPETDNELEELKIRLGSAEKLGTIYNECADKLAGGDLSLLSLSGQLNRHLTYLQKIDTSNQVSKIVDEAGGLEIQIGELARSLDAYGDSLGHDPNRLEEIMERIHLLDGLKKKYGSTPEEILVFLEKSNERYEELESSGENLKKFDDDIQSLEKQMEKIALKIREERKRASKKIEKTIIKELEDLEMKGVSFKIKIEPSDFNLRGKDEVEFLLSANQGEELKSLSKVASGGEASRIQLALKRFFSKVQPVSAFVFDEIDSGIGGRLGPAIGEKLRQIASNHTVISITHLAPVAAHASCHLRASITMESGKTKVAFNRI